MKPTTKGTIMTTYEKNLIWEVEFLTRVVRESTNVIKENSSAPKGSYLYGQAEMESRYLMRTVDNLNAAIEKLEAYRALPFWKKMFIK